MSKKKPIATYSVRVTLRYREGGESVAPPPNDGLSAIIAVAIEKLTGLDATVTATRTDK